MDVGLIKHKKQSRCYMIISSLVSLSGDWSLIVYCDKKKKDQIIIKHLHVAHYMTHIT